MATSFYIVFAIITYYYIGPSVMSPSLLSLVPLWSKICFGIAIPNFFIAGSLYSHTAAKLLFVRLFRRSRHLHSHTVLGWGTWLVLILIMNGAAFVFAVGVPIFNDLLGIAASLFAAWYTYGLAGAFWLHDAAHDGDGTREWRKRWVMASLMFATIAAGAFICVAGLYVSIKEIIIAYQTGAVPPAFSC